MPKPPEAADLWERLERYGRALRECRIVIEGRAPEDPPVAAAFARLHAAFEGLGDLAAAREALTEPRARERFILEVGELTRSHAVLVSTLARDRDRLRGQLVQARAARRACQAAVPAEPTGRSCDLSA